MAADLAAVKRAMLASRVDATLLTTHDTSAFIAMLAPDSRPTVTNDFAKNKAFAYATRLDDGTTIAPAGVRAHGTVTFQAITEHLKDDKGNELKDTVRGVAVTTNFIWVYPIAATRTGTGANLIAIRDQVTWLFYANTDVAPNSRGLWIKAAQAFGGNLDCDKIRTDVVALPAISVTESQMEASAVYNLAAPFQGATFVC